MDEVSERLGEHLDYIWGDTPGMAYVPIIEKGSRFRKFMVEWPKGRASIIRHILAQNALGNDVYYSPSLFKIPEAGKNPGHEKEDFLGAQVLWVDFDGNAPANWEEKTSETGIPMPSRVLQSSVEHHEHAYWRLDEFSSDIEKIEDANRAIAYRLGADKSGWDANQLLRPPFTNNFGYKFSTTGEQRKPWFDGEPTDVVVLRQDDSVYQTYLFDKLDSPEREALERISVGGPIPLIDVLALGNWSESLLEIFRMTKEEAALASPDKRSGTLMRLAYTAAEHGMTDEQIYTILDDADKRWEKYTKRSKAGRHKIFLDTIARARAKVGYLTTETIALESAAHDSPLLGDDPLAVFDYASFINLDIHVDWLFENLLTRDGMGAITGQPGVGKTQLALQFGISAAAGVDNVLGWNNVSGEHKVLVFSLEMGKASLHHFMSTIKGAYEDHVIPLSKNLHFVPIGMSMHVDKPRAQQYIDNLLTQYKPDLIVIDSMQRTASKELTDELAAKKIMEYFIEVIYKHKAAVIFVHHDRKRANDGQTRASETSDLYGSQFISAEQQFVVRVVGTGTSLVRIENPKSRMGPQREPFVAKRNEYLQYDLDDGGGILPYGAGHVHIGPTTGNTGDTGTNSGGVGLPQFGL